MYCTDDSVNLTDYHGNIAIFDDVAVWAFIGLSAVLMLLISCAGSDGLAWIGASIVDGGNAAWNWTKNKLKPHKNKKPFGPEIDKGKENTLGYYYHYHIYNKLKKGHVFFLFW